MSVTAKNLCRDEFFYGHKACAGCGGSLAVRNALKVLGKNAVAVLPAGCMSAVGFNFHSSVLQIMPLFLHSLARRLC